MGFNAANLWIPGVKPLTMGQSWRS